MAIVYGMTQRIDVIKIQVGIFFSGPDEVGI